MPPETAKYLHDVVVACDYLVQFTSDKSFEDFQQDPLLRSAVERQFITIGEALTKAIKVEPLLASQINHIRKIIGFRNILVHSYSAIEDATVWGVIENDLAVLHEQVRQLLAGFEKGYDGG